MVAALIAALVVAVPAWGASSITTPANNSRTSDNTPTLTGTASTGGGTNANVTVKIYAGAAASGTPVQTLPTTRNAATGAWTVTATTLADNTYTAQSQQTGDATGGTPVTFTVDTAAPTPTLTTPANGSFTNSTTPGFSGSAGVATGDSPTVTVKIYAGATATGTPVQTLTFTQSGGVWGSPPGASTLAQGKYTAQATQADDVGNSGNSTANTFTVDTTAPALTLVNPANASTTNDSTPTVSGAAGNATGDSPTVTVKIYAGATATGTPVQTFDVARSAAAWSGSAAQLGDGTYTAQATQLDAAGNSKSVTNTFTVDTTPPALTITSPGAATNDTTPALGGTAGNAAGDSSTVTLEIYAGSTATGSPVQTSTVSRSGATWTGAAGQLAPGTYTLRALQSDAVNTAAVTQTFQVDTTAPTVTLDKPADGEDATPTFTGTASDATAVTVRVYSNGSVAETLTAPGGPGPWSVDASPDLASGTYAVQATQTDAAGNTGTSALHTFVVRAPVTPSGTGPVTPTPPATTPDPTPPPAQPSLLSPFPIVRIVGSLTDKGAKLSLFTVRAPAGSTVQVRCKGRSCPFKVRSSAAGDTVRTVPVKRMTGRELRAGVVIEIRVSHVDRVGKFTRFLIRKGKSPLRIDACLMPNDLKPARCPA